MHTPLRRGLLFWGRQGWGLPLFTLQRYHSQPRDVKRQCRFGGNLTLCGLAIFRTKVLNTSSERSEESEYVSKTLFCWCLQILRFPLRLTNEGSCFTRIFLCRLTLYFSIFVKTIKKTLFPQSPKVEEKKKTHCHSYHKSQITVRFSEIHNQINLTRKFIHL